MNNLVHASKLFEYKARRPHFKKDIGSVHFEGPAALFGLSQVP